MHLTIISPDPVHIDVLSGVAERNCWRVSAYTTLDDYFASGIASDAVAVDVERMDASLTCRLSDLARYVGAERLFILAEDAGDAREDDLAALVLLKPFHPTALILAVEQALMHALSARPARPVARRRVAVRR